MTREELLKRGRTRMPARGVETVTVPGALAGWDALLKKYGTITLAQALQPAIGYAENGFPVTPVISRRLGGRGRDVLQRDAGGEGDVHAERRTRPRPASGSGIPTTRARCARSPQAGRRRSTAARSDSSIVARVQELGGFLTLDDLKKNQPTWVTPISRRCSRAIASGSCRRTTRASPRSRCCKILEPYDLKAMGHNSAPYLHHLIEAKKLAYADLARYVGDADHLDDAAEPHAVRPRSSPSGGATSIERRRRRTSIRVRR